MREIILPVPHVTQGTQPWCWAACCRMVIGYTRALKFTPSLEELVEFGHRLPKGSCEADKIPVEASNGNTIVAMRVLMSLLGRRTVERHTPANINVTLEAIRVGHPIILHSWADRSCNRSHVVVARGMRESAAGAGGTIELLLNDPAQAQPFWWPVSLLEADLIELLVIRRDQPW